MKRNEMGMLRGVSEKEKTGAVPSFDPAVKMEYQETRPDPSCSVRRTPSSVHHPSPRLSAALAMSLVFLALVLGFAQPARGAGVTIVTHGFQFSDIDHGHGWVEAMGDYIADRAGGTKYIYRLEITGGYPITATNPHGLGLGSFTCQYSGLQPIDQSWNAEVVIKLYWDSVARSFTDGVTTREIAEATLTALTDSPFAPFLTKKLAETPIHLIGHSRGGSVVAEISRLLGEHGIWVHQMTTLDPHPTFTIDGSGDDAAVNVYENVLFADNYYEDIFGTFPQGQSIDGADNRHLTSLDGGYPDVPDGHHSDVHLWYHGTVNTDQNASDGEQTITDTMRGTWYTSYEDRGTGAGFYYSRLGGGGWLLDGFLYGYYNNGDFNNSPANRISLTRNANERPSLIKIDPDFGISVQAGNAFPVHYVFQSFDSTSSTLVYLDPDQNPYNGNEIALPFTSNPNPQSSTARGTRTIDVSVTVPLSVSPGFYYVYGKITNPNGTRYLYALGQVQVVGTPGSLTVNLYPAGAVSAGAQWRVGGGSYYNSGATVTNLTSGSHTVSFKTVTGYTTPADKSVTITGGVNTTDSGTYTAISGVAQLTGLSILGPATVNENANGQFTATAYFSDSSQQTVTASATWSENSSVTTISSSGLLSAGSVSSDTPVTVSASYVAGGITKTASTNVTIVNTGGGGAQTQELIVNGGFESGSTSWTLSGFSGTGIGALGQARSGTYFLWLGGAANENDAAYQTITIPANATAATLSFYWNINTLEVNPTAYDTFTSTIRNTSGTNLATVINLSNINQTAPGNPNYIGAHK